MSFYQKFEKQCTGTVAFMEAVTVAFVFSESEHGPDFDRTPSWRIWLYRLHLFFRRFHVYLYFITQIKTKYNKWEYLSILSQNFQSETCDSFDKFEKQCTDYDMMSWRSIPVTFRLTAVDTFTRSLQFHNSQIPMEL